MTVSNQNWCSLIISASSHNEPPELIDATKKYGEVEALKGVTIRIELGEVVAMLGPNGAGKTTSISLLLGLRKPTSGKALLFGLEPTNLLARSRVGVMLQESGVPQMLKVREIVDLFRSYYPKPLPRDRAIAMAGLEEKTNALVKELSGGQRQRLYFALAVCGNPDVLFLDEPTVGMDVEGRRSFIERIAEEFNVVPSKPGSSSERIFPGRRSRLLYSR